MVHLDAFTLIHHRPSGLTHLLTEPAPEILAMLGEAGSTVADLERRLGASFDVADADRGAILARLDELVACGLVRVT